MGENENSDQLLVDGDIEKTITNYVANINSEVRQDFPRVLLLLLKQQPLEETLANIHLYISGILVASEDKLPVVRISLVEQIPYIFFFCHEHTCPDLGYYFYDRLLQIVLQFLEDEDIEVRREAYSSLQSMLLGKCLIEKKQIEEKICPKILQLTQKVFPDAQMEFVIKAITVMSRIVPIIGPEKTEEYFLDHFIELCSCKINNIKKTCATIFPIMCYVLGANITETKLLEPFSQLCDDMFWGVRKACAESIPLIALVCSRECRRTKLAPMVLKLTEDMSKWVVISTLKILGEFISTFAEPCVTGLAYTYNRELRIINPTDPEFNELSDQNVLNNFKYYVNKFSESGLKSTSQTTSLSLSSSSLENKITIPSSSPTPSSSSSSSSSTTMTNNVENKISPNPLSSFEIAKTIIDKKKKLINQIGGIYDNEPGLIHSMLQQKRQVYHFEYKNSFKINNKNASMLEICDNSFSSNIVSSVTTISTATTSDSETSSTTTTTKTTDDVNFSLPLSSPSSSSSSSLTTSSSQSSSLPSTSLPSTENKISPRKLRFRRTFDKESGLVDLPSIIRRAMDLNASKILEPTSLKNQVYFSSRNKHQPYRRDTAETKENDEGILVEERGGEGDIQNVEKQTATVITTPTVTTPTTTTVADFDTNCNANSNLLSVTTPVDIFSNNNNEILKFPVVATTTTATSVAEATAATTTTITTTNVETTNNNYDHDHNRKENNYNYDDTKSKITDLLVDNANNAVNLNSDNTDSAYCSNTDDDDDAFTDFNSYKYWYIEPPQIEKVDDNVPINLCEWSSTLDEEAVRKLGIGIGEYYNDNNNSSDSSMRKFNIFQTKTMKTKTILDDIDGVINFEQQNIVPPNILKAYVNMHSLDEEEIILNCAYTFPAVALTIGKENWNLIKCLLQYLCDEIDWKVRKTIAASIEILANILGKEITTNDLVPIFLGFFKDLDEVKIEAIRNFAGFLKVVDLSKHDDILEDVGICLRVDSTVNWRIKEDLAKQIFPLVEMYKEINKQDNLLYLTSLTGLFLEDKISCVREIAANALASIIRISNQIHREAIINYILQEFARSSNWRKRQTFLNILFKLNSLNEEILGHFFQLVIIHIEILSHDPIPNIRLLVAKILVQLIITTERNILEGKSKEDCVILRTLRMLQKDKDRDVREISCSIISIIGDEEKETIEEKEKEMKWDEWMRKAIDEFEGKLKLFSSSTATTTTITATTEYFEDDYNSGGMMNCSSSSSYDDISRGIKSYKLNGKKNWKSNTNYNNFWMNSRAIENEQQQSQSQQQLQNVVDDEEENWDHEGEWWS